MAGLNETPRGNRIHIAFFGLRNAGKSTLVNAFTGQNLAIVSEVAGTTTDPVSKAMEILPLGPCLVTDTAGLDDTGALGEQRVKKSLDVLATTDVAVWVHGDEVGGQRSEVKQMSDRPLSDPRPSTFDLFQEFLSECKRRGVVVLEYHRGDSVEELKGKIAAIKLEEKVPGLLEGLVSSGDRVVCVCPIDESAPKGRLILPQQQVIRECLDRHLSCTVCQPEELFDCLIVGLFELRGRLLVITDSQAFGSVSKTIERFEQSCPQKPGQSNNPTIQQSNNPPIPQSPNPTIQQSPNPPIPQSNNPTIQQSNNPPIPQSNNPTIQQSNNPTISLTSFSILFARQKGDLAEYVKGLKALANLKDGDTVLVAEGCTHHRQCNDIGSVKIPKALGKLTGKKLNFAFASGTDFLDSQIQAPWTRLSQSHQAEEPCPCLTRLRQTRLCESEISDLPSHSSNQTIKQSNNQTISLVVLCGGCMLTRREVLRRIDWAREAGVPVVNYGMVLAVANGLALEDVLI